MFSGADRDAVLLLALVLSPRSTYGYKVCTTWWCWK